MKTSIILLALLFSTHLFSQEESKNQEVNRYLQKSLRQKKTANVLMITGGVLIISGMITISTDNKKGFISSEQLVGGSLITLGAVSALTSIPFYISAGSNKSKSRKISPQVGSFKTPENNYLTAGVKFEF